jgi:hypothetical protein
MGKKCNVVIWKASVDIPKTLRRRATAAAICHSLGMLIAGTAIYSFGLLQASPMHKITLCILPSYAIGAFVFYHWKKLSEEGLD